MDRSREQWVHRKEDVRRRALQKGVPFEMTGGKIKQLFIKQKGKCFYCGISEKKSKFLYGMSLQLERIVPKLGYTEKNTVFACTICNYIKADLIISVSDMRMIGRVFKNALYKRNRETKGYYVYKFYVSLQQVFRASKKYGVKTI